jgi:hypothetical protein
VAAAEGVCKNREKVLAKNSRCADGGTKPCAEGQNQAFDITEAAYL